MGSANEMLFVLTTPQYAKGHMTLLLKIMAIYSSP